MALLNVQLPLQSIQTIVTLLGRIAVALERLAGPVIDYRPPVPATLRDYALVTPEDVQRVRAAEMEFGQAHMVIPGSPAYLAAIEEFERQLAEASGPEAVANLPWRVRTGTLPEFH